MQPSTVITYLKKNYSLDLRALALMRIGIGAVLVADLLVRFGSVTAHYTNQGVLPLAARETFFNTAWQFCLHAWSGGTGLQVILFCLSLVFALLLFAGYQTRFVTFLSWLLLMSLHNRNPMINQGGDDLLRIVLFWGIFLPWGTRYSFDSIKNKAVENSLNNNAYFDVPALGYGLLIFSVYFFSFLLKTSAEWRTEGTALYYALSLDQLALPVGKLIYPHPALLKLLTFFACYTELIAPLLFFVPVFNPLFRTIGILSILLLHAGIALTLFIGLFFIVGMVSVIGLLPAQVMDRLENRLAIIIALLKKRITKLVHPSVKTNRLSRLKRFMQANFYLKLTRNSFLFFFIAYCLLWNIENIPRSGFSISPGFRWLGVVLKFEQNWSMFSPTVLKEDGWYILEGKTADGSLIDLYHNGEPIDYSKPENVLNYIENDRWRKFGESYRISSFPLRIHYCNYALRKWNNEHPEKKVEKLNVIYMNETTRADYKTIPPFKEMLCTCAGDSIN